MNSTGAAPAELPAANEYLGKQDAPQETCDATAVLSEVLMDAGLTMLKPMFHSDERGTYVQLDKIDAGQAVELARLVRKGMKRSYQTALDLRAAAQAHGLHDFPSPFVQHAKIRLGDVSVTTADRLACLLGAPPQPEKKDITEALEAEHVVDRLAAAFGKATRGGFMDLTYHPYCQRCGGDPAITLGALEVETARRLVKALGSPS